MILECLYVEPDALSLVSLQLAVKFISLWADSVEVVSVFGMTYYLFQCDLTAWDAALFHMIEKYTSFEFR